MTNEAARKNVRKKAQGFFDSGITQNEFVQKGGKIENPIPILDPDGKLNSWFVGVVMQSKLVGFMQLSQDLVLMRYSTFQRHPLSIDQCPDVRTWLDRGYILERARTAVAQSDTLEHPFLTYDRSPSRIAWAVRTTDRRGQKKLIFVAGDYVYLSKE